MIAVALLVALAQPGVLTVETESRRTLVPLVETATGPALAAEALAPVVPTQLDLKPTGRYLLRIGGIPFELADQVPFARVGDEIIPLVASPHLVRGRLHVPLQVVGELYPRFAPNVSFDADRIELRVGVKARATPVVETPAPTSAGSVVAAGSLVDPVAPAGLANGQLQARRKRVVVLDAGHGGRDAGTTGRTRSGAMLVEKDVTLAVSNLVAAELRARSIDVVQTRSSDVFVELPERGRIANDQRGDIFISIHVNASAPGARNGSAARGVETYFLAVAKTEEAQRVADMENASIRFETQAEVARDDPLAFIINDMAENEHLRESSDLAVVMQRRLSTRHPGPVGDRGVKQGPFRVLVTSYMPAVLVELGFASNTEDAAYRLDVTNQKRMAEAIAAAAVDYFEQYERRVGSGSPNR
jgi:N-acetylmuramoyl-L-alanine amidase